MAWRRPGDKPLSEPMVVILLTHICVTRPQWVKPVYSKISKYPPTNLNPTPNLKSTLHRLISAATGLWVPCTNGYQIWWPNFRYQIWFVPDWYKAYQIPKLKCFSSHFAVVFTKCIGARCYVENEDVVWASQQAMLQLFLSDQQFYCPRCDLH